MINPVINRFKMINLSTILIRHNELRTITWFKDNSKKLLAGAGLLFVAYHVYSNKGKICQYLWNLWLVVTHKNEEIEKLKDEVSEKNSLIMKQNEQIAKQNQTIGNLNKDNKHLHEKLHDCTNRLAQEMGTKVASDETSVENIGIRNRPMNIADDYQRLCSNEWLDAKSNLDEVIGTDSNKIICGFLCSIMEVTAETLSAFITDMYKSLEENNSLQVVLPSSQSNVKDHEKQKLPAEISNAIGDYLRNNTGGINKEHFIKAIRANLDDKYSDSNSIWLKTKDSREMQVYMQAVIRVVLGMVIQRPQMTFQICKEWKEDGSIDLCWGSDNPAGITSPDSMLVTTVYPMLYHGNKLMAKGKVLVTVQPQTVEVYNRVTVQSKDDSPPEKAENVEEHNQNTVLSEEDNPPKEVQTVGENNHNVESKEDSQQFNMTQ